MNLGGQMAQQMAPPKPQPAPAPAAPPPQSPEERMSGLRTRYAEALQSVKDKRNMSGGQQKPPAGPQPPGAA